MCRFRFGAGFSIVKNQSVGTVSRFDVGSIEECKSLERRKKDEGIGMKDSRGGVKGPWGKMGIVKCENEHLFFDI